MKIIGGGGGRKRVTRTGTRSVDAAAADRANRESEPRVVLSQKLGGTSIESDGGSNETESSTNLVDQEAIRELADHKEEEGHIEKEEEGNQGKVDPQGCQEEDKGDDEPGSQKDSNGVGELARVTGVGSRNAKVRMKEGRVGQPETTV